MSFMKKISKKVKLQKIDFIFIYLILLFYFLFTSCKLCFKFSIIFPFILSIIIVLVLGKIKYLSKFEKVLSNFAFLLLIVFSIFILYNAGLFTKEIPLFVDTPYHFLASFYTYEKLIPKFYNVVGYSLDFHAGFLFFNGTPFGGPILVSFLYSIFSNFVSITLIYRYVMAFSFLLPIIAVYLFSKQVTNSPIIGLVSSIFWLASLHDLFMFGIYYIYMSIGLFLFSFYFYNRYFMKRDLHLLFLSSILSSISLLFYPRAIIFLIIYVFSKFILSKKKNIYAPLILITSSIAVLSSFLFYEFTFFSYFLPVRSVIYFPELYDIGFQFFKWFESSVFLFISFLASFFLIKSMNKNLKIILFSCVLIFLSTIFLGFLQKGFRFSQLDFLIVTDRIFFLLKPLLAIFSSYIILRTIKILLDTKILGKLFIFFLISAFFISTIPFMSYLINEWHNPNTVLFEDVHGWSILKAHKLNLTGGIFTFQPKNETIEAFEWIKNNTDKNSRILFEDSMKAKHGSYIMALAPIWTDRYFIGGPYPINDWKGNKSSYDGIVFGKDIKNYKVEEFEYKLQEFNIKWLVVWSPDLVNFLGKNSEIFKLLGKSSNNSLKFYEYLNAANDYLHINDNSSAKLEKLDVNYFLIFVQNASKDDTLTLKFSFLPQWHAYKDGKELKIIETDSSLMQIKLEEKGDYYIEVKYEELLIEKLLKFISMFSILLLLVLTGYFWYKSKVSRAKK